MPRFSRIMYCKFIEARYKESYNSSQKNILIMNKKAVLAIIVLGLIIILSIWTQWEMSKIEKSASTEPVVAVQALEVKPKKIPQGEVVRKTRVQRARDSIENIFYVGEEIIVTQKVYADGKIEQDGKIPDGRVKFYDEYEQTYGEEYYSYGKKHGRVLTYYQDGKLKSEAEYRYGRIIKNKEYYPQGRVRFEVDYSDALPGGDQKESGIGKLYYSDGTLKYEWNLTLTNKGGYKRSYNQDGTLRAESKFDEYGRLIENPEPVLEKAAEVGQ